MVYLLKWALCTIVTAVGRAQTSSQIKQLSPSKTRYRVSDISEGTENALKVPKRIGRQESPFMSQ